jgi:hypothetical protein
MGEVNVEITADIFHSSFKLKGMGKEQGWKEGKK